MHAHRIVPYSLTGNFVYFLIRQTILPVVIVYGLFFAVSRDSVEYKVKSFLPLMLCFYMAFLPYTVVSSGSAIVPAYMIFVKLRLVILLWKMIGFIFFTQIFR